MENTEKQTEALLSGYYQLAYHGFVNSSFSPERRAKDTIEIYSAELSEDLDKIKALDGDVERYKDAYIKKFTAWLGARTRCFSTMITGGSGVNVRAHEKANKAENNRYQDFVGWRNKVINKLTRPESTDIVKGTDGAIEKMEAKLEKLQNNQELMKAANKILKDKKESKEIRLMELGLTNKSAVTLLTPDRYNCQGFPSYSLTNNNATINRLKKEIAAESARMAKYEEGNKEYTHGSAEVIENVDDNRLQLFFDGKPEDDVRTTLKRNGFRWAPSNGCWQRQLTENAIWALKRISI